MHIYRGTEALVTIFSNVDGVTIELLFGLVKEKFDLCSNLNVKELTNFIGYDFLVGEVIS